MAAEDYIFTDSWDEADIDADDNGFYGQPNPFKFCKYCGKGFLSWKKLDGKWRLIDNAGQVHSCQGFSIYKKEERDYYTKRATERTNSYYPKT